MPDTNAVLVEEPKGIAFFNVKSGDTHYCRLEPTIQAYINSSDMGINASREQDFGWKLASDWVKRVKAFRRDPMQMQILNARNQGQKVTTTQILYYLYGEELRAYQEDLEENENPFEEEYLQSISGKPVVDAPKAPAVDLDTDEDDDDISSLVDPADIEPATPAEAPQKSQSQLKREAITNTAKTPQK